MEELQKLYNVLVEQDLISKPFEEFEVEFSNPEYVDRVFNAVKEKDLYSFDKESFTEKYSSKKKNSRRRYGIRFRGWFAGFSYGY